MFTKQEALKKQCRIVPMMVLPGGIAGGIQVQAPNCAADECLHWRWLEQPSSFDQSNRCGGCALDADIAAQVTQPTFRIGTGAP